MIELIVVIVILGILAATALPKFIDIKSDAQAASLNAMASTASSAMSLNYAGCSANNNATAANKCVTVSNCNSLTDILQGGLPSNFSVNSVSLTSAGTKNGTTAACELSMAGYTPKATFTGIGAGNP